MEKTEKQTRVARNVPRMRLQCGSFSYKVELTTKHNGRRCASKRKDQEMLLSYPVFAVSSILQGKVLHSRRHWTEANTNACIKGKFNLYQIVGSSRNLKFITRSVSKEGNTSVEYDAPFPDDYFDLLKQAKKATDLALKDGKKLMEIEFPTAGLQSVPGDGEGGNEMTGSMQLIREFCDILVTPEKATRTRIFFPEANEVKFARQVFEGASFKLDYLTKPSFFEDFGFGEKVKMADRVKPDDELFLVGYPYFNVNEMIVVEELYKEAVINTTRKLIIFNGELDRIRSGYYPPFFYPKLAALTKTLMPMMETVYYIHNFKGRNGGTLFRCYPAPWRVLRKVGNKYFCVHQQETMPSLKEVALDILPAA